MTWPTMTERDFLRYGPREREGGRTGFGRGELSVLAGGEDAEQGGAAEGKTDELGSAERKL